jgi:hypothetical protein
MSPVIPAVHTHDLGDIPFDVDAALIRHECELHRSWNDPRVSGIRRSFRLEVDAHTPSILRLSRFSYVSTN